MPAVGRLISGRNNGRRSWLSKLLGRLHGCQHGTGSLGLWPTCRTRQHASWYTCIGWWQFISHRCLHLKGKVNGCHRYQTAWGLHLHFHCRRPLRFPACLVIQPPGLQASYAMGRHGMVLPMFALDQSDLALLAALVDVRVSWRVRHVGHRPRLPVPCWQHPVCATKKRRRRSQ